MSQSAENDAAVPGDRTYLDALSENGSFGDVLDFAYELLGRLERATTPASSVAENDAPDFDRLAVETAYARDEWERAWHESDGRHWQMIAALVEAGTYSPTSAIKAVARVIPPAKGD